MTKTTIRISGMTCAHCEKRIRNALLRVKGVESVTASFPKKHAIVSFDPQKTDEQAMQTAIEREGYKVLGMGNAKKQPVGKVIPVFIIVLSLYFIVKYTVGFDFINLIPRIDTSVSLAALFVIGLFTSVHCIAMCGGINLSQSVGSAEGASSFKRPLLYNLGRVLSYTIVGGIVGGIGSVLFLSQTLKGIIMLLAAVFMVLMGLSMLGWLPSWLVPRLPSRLSRQANRAKVGRGPFVVGLLNGLLPCGPLQAMQLYALSTGSVLTGALSMFLFSMGTVPLMLGAGMIFAMLKGRFTRSIMRVSAVLVILIAVAMSTNAGGLLGWNTKGSPRVENTSPQTTGSNASQNGKISSDGYLVASIKDGVQEVEGNLASSSYPSILVKKGVPVRFHLKADNASINGCNQTVEIPNFHIEKSLTAGDNIIEFTPNDTGTIVYTCWMGMTSGQIKVVDSLDNVAAASSPGATLLTQPGTGDNTAQGNQGCCSVGGQ